MKNILLFACSLLTYLTSYAQVRLPEGTRTKLGRGLWYETYQIADKSLFESNQYISIVRAKTGRCYPWRFGLASADSATKTNHAAGLLKPTSEIARKAGAIAAINAGFFDMKNGGAVDFIKIDGVVYDTSRLAAKQRVPFKESISALTIHRNKIQIVKGHKEKGWEASLAADNVLLTGPLLLLGHDVQPLMKSPFNDNRHPRTCACLTSKNELLLVAVDGRSAEAQGMSLPELTQLAQHLGCRDAINFDGGGSTTLYLAGRPFDGVVNHPSDNKKFDHEGQRKVSNILYIKRK